MKKIAAFVLAALTSLLGARAALYLEEAFPYAVGDLKNQGGWSGGSGSQVMAGNLNYPGLQSPSVTSNRASLPSTAATTVKPFNASAIATGDLYLSFILKQTTLAASTTGGTVAGLDDDGVLTTSNGRVAAALGVHLKQTNSNRFLVGIRKGQGASGAGGGTDLFYTGNSFAVGDVLLIVARYSFGAGAGDDTVTLWVNPPADSFSGWEPPPSIPATTTGNTTDPTQLQYAFLRCNSSTTSGVNEVDDLRIGSTWAEVTPNGGVNPQMTNAQPRITAVLLNGNHLILRGTQGTSNGVFRVLFSTNAALPVLEWRMISTNSFDALGNFDSTNPIPAAPPVAFYRLLLGGNLNIPITAPAITTQPTNLTVHAGEDAHFIAAASGTAPLDYQWFFNTNTTLAGANSAALSVPNAQFTNEGTYQLRVTNSVGAATSAMVTLTVHSPPIVLTQPHNLGVMVSNPAIFNVAALGSPTLRYQWYFNTHTLLAGATDSSFTIASALTNDAGSYSVVVSNDYGAVTSAFATLTVNLPTTTTPNFDLLGFGAPTSGGGILPETDANYRKVYTPGDLRLALANNNTRIIEIMNDLDLGWNEIGATNQTGAFRANKPPSLHPVLIASGVSLIDLQNKNGLTIFSAGGATIRHAELNIKRTHNVIIRNLKFDELWEWDEATKGDYDSKDWDFITIGDSGNCTNVWIDHCDFTKAYDGVVDLKGGNNTVTISWCRFLADEGGPTSFVRQQILNLETNGVSHAMYDYLRAHGFSVEDIIAIARPQKKGHLAGANDQDPANADLKLTLHHNYYLNLQDRMPRLRAGNAHVFNIYVNNSEARAAKLLRDARVTALGGSLGSYKFDVVLNGAISTEAGAVLVENSHLIDVLYPLRNNQTDPSDPTYTGKIRALDTIYTLDGVTFRGGSEASGSPLSPIPAPAIPFSWNGFASLPYTYYLDDPSTLAGSLPNRAAGAGKIWWEKSNWLKTTY